jgi:ADP-heptose:LPS heptosyltransferase
LAPGSITSTVAFKDDPRYDLMFSVVSRQRRADGDHMTEVIRKHLKAVIAVNTSEWHPTITIPASTLERVKVLLATMDGYSGFIHLNLHASLAIREWSMDNVIGFCKAFRAARADLGIVVTGDPRRIAPEGVALEREAIAGVLVLPSLSQLDLCAVVRASALVVTPDTSLTHIASAERKPVVTLHYRKNEWFPYDVPHEIIYASDERSVHSIPVSKVIASVDALLPHVFSN